MTSRQLSITKQPPAKAGGFELRTGSPDTRRLNDASYGDSILNSSFGLGSKWCSRYCLIISSVICPTVAQKYPRAQKCRPQYLFFRCGNSSNSRLAVLPLIRLIISLGAIVGGALTKICTWSLLTTPLTIVSQTFHKLDEPLLELVQQHPLPKFYSGILSPKQNDTQFEKPYDCHTCSPWHTSKRVILSAEANRLEAGGFNLVMENKGHHRANC